MASKSLSIFQTVTALLDPFKVATASTKKRASDLCLEIALYTYKPGQVIEDHHRNTLFALLPKCIQTYYAMLIPSGIILCIVEYAMVDSAFSWSKCDDEPTDNLLEFRDNSTRVRFRDPSGASSSHFWGRTMVGGRDYIIVRSEQLIEENQRIKINAYIKSKGDEMWIGFMDSAKYHHDRSLRYHEHAVTYYDRGSIQAIGFGYNPSGLTSYGSGDWINFEILLTDSLSDKCVLNVCKNGAFDEAVDASAAEDLYFSHAVCLILELDAENDEVFIERTIEYD